MSSVWMYQGALYCVECGRQIKQECQALGIEDNGDSDTFPQEEWLGVTEQPEHCDCRETCSMAEDLREYGLKESDRLYGAESWYVGKLLSEGVENEEVVERMEVETPYERALKRMYQEEL